MKEEIQLTIGETIQYHRKRLGLSQEDLGQKLNLSRQTVSLWENDQTLPTIDNFIRLKEIFGVSVDTLLGCAPAPEAEEKPQPVESYRFTFTEDDNKIRYKAWITALVRVLLIPFVFLMMMLLFAFNGSVTSTRGTVVTQHDFKDAIPIVIFMLIVYTIIAVCIIRQNANLYKLRLSQRQIKTYEYNTFYNYFTVSIEKNDETTSFHKIYFEDIEKIEDSERFFSLIAGGISFDIPKRLLPENSFCSFLAKSYPAKTKTVKKTDAWAIASVGLFIASFFSFPIAMLLLKKPASDMLGFLENMRLFFVPLPIPIASIILGIVLKKKKYYTYKKNIVIGCIMAALLCIYGCFSFAFSNIYKADNAPVLALEEYLDTDIPQHLQIVTQDWTDANQNVNENYVVSYYSTVYFDKTTAEKYAKTLADDDRWLSARPTELTDITNPLFQGDGYDYYLIYNITENTFNTLPGQKGQHKFINAFYSKASRKLLIVEYSMDYK